MGLALEDFQPFPTMADIYRSLPNLRQDLLFTGSTRLLTPGFRWAPFTFLGAALLICRDAERRQRME